MSHEDELFELLKHGGDTTPQTSVDPNDESESTEGVTQLYPDPPDHETPPPEPVQFTSAAVEGSKMTRGGVVDRSLDHKPADKADQALIAQNFSHGKSGDFETHSLHLKDKSVEKVSHPRSETLSQMVRRVVGI